jgi:hypothetical protein
MSGNGCAALGVDELPPPRKGNEDSSVSKEFITRKVRIMGNKNSARIRWDTVNLLTFRCLASGRINEPAGKTLFPGT